MGRLVFHEFQCEMELDYITVSRLLLVPVAKGLWKHEESVSVNQLIYPKLSSALCTCSPVATGDFGGLSPPKQSSNPPNWSMKHYTSGEFCQFLDVKPPVQT